MGASRSRSRGFCAAPGSTCPSAPRSRSPKRSRAVGLDAGPHVYWAGGPRCVRAPRGRRPLRPGLRRVLVGGDGRPTTVPTARAVLDRHARLRRTTATTTTTGLRRRRRWAGPRKVRWSRAEVLRHRDFATLQPGRARRGPPADGRPAASPARPGDRRRTADGARAAAPTCGARSAARCAPAASRSTARSRGDPATAGASCCCAT